MTIIGQQGYRFHHSGFL